MDSSFWLRYADRLILMINLDKELMFLADPTPELPTELILGVMRNRVVSYGSGNNKFFKDRQVGEHFEACAERAVRYYQCVVVAAETPWELDDEYDFEDSGMIWRCCTVVSIDGRKFTLYLESNPVKTDRIKVWLRKRPDCG